MIKVLYIYAGADRSELEDKVRRGEWPDNWFFGYMQLQKKMELEVCYFQAKKENFRGNLHLFFHAFKQLRNADVIVITSSAHIGLLNAKSFGFLMRQKWVVLNLDLTTKLKTDTSIVKPLSLANRIICLSNYQLNDLLSRGLKNCTLVHFGIDNHFYEQLNETEEGIILSVGRDSGRDYKTLLDAVKAIDEKVVIICRPKNVSGLSLPANVEVLDEMTPLETRRYYERAAISIVPSKKKSTQGSDCSGQTVILESMAYGRPVIASRKEWFKDYFTENHSLIVVEPENAFALSQAIKMVSSDKNLRRRLIQEARLSIDTKFNSEIMGDKIMKIILEIV